jgi:hypothetical protein
MHKKALVFVPEIITEYAVDSGAFLFNDQFGEIVILQPGHFYFRFSIPGAGSGLGRKSTDCQEAT